MSPEPPHVGCYYFFTGLPSHRTLQPQVQFV